MVRIVLTAILVVILTACGIFGIEPSGQLVQRAIALQLTQTQQQLSQQLHTNFKGFEINRLSITKQEPLQIQNLPAYRVRGIYYLTLKPTNRQVTQQHRFEVYLQRQKEGKTWRLAIPEINGKNTNLWRTYLITF